MSFLATVCLKPNCQISLNPLIFLAMHIYSIFLGAYSEMKKLQVAKETSTDESMDVDSSEGILCKDVCKECVHNLYALMFRSES